jgi:chemotaxis protein MotC
MIDVRHVAAALTLAGGLAAAAQAQDAKQGAIKQSPAPYELVRSLNALQDQTSSGNRSAHKAQRPLIQRIGEEMKSAPVEVWKEPKNGRALVSYVLSGGEADLLKRLMDDKAEVGGVDPNLAAAAIAYAERRSEEARTLFDKVEARALEPSLAAHVALVQGVVLSEREPETAIKRFELARLLAPGSIVEQGALRRQTMVSGKLGRWHEAERLAAQYLRRFGEAVYAPTFYRELAEQLATQPDTRDEEQFTRLVTLFDMLGEKERRQTYLLLAERAVLAGKIKMARFAAARASELYGSGSTERVRLQVYGAAADVATDKSGDGLSALQEIDRRRLGNRDTLLVDAANEVGHDVTREPALTDPLATNAGDKLTVVDAARKSIDKADELLEATKK